MQLFCVIMIITEIDCAMFNVKLCGICEVVRRSVVGVNFC